MHDLTCKIIFRVHVHVHVVLSSFSNAIYPWIDLCIKHTQDVNIYGNIHMYTCKNTWIVFRMWVKFDYSAYISSLILHDVNKVSVEKAKYVFMLYVKQNDTYMAFH